MKIERDDLPKSEQFNTEDDGELQMEASAKAFQIVSSGLYSNKVRAVIRELSTNAWDSHIDAGNTDTPFTVHLPNNIEPWFSVRDYGVGLDREEVKNVFLTYFKSTKNDRNDSTGMLGLGSKSPLSMSNSFNVTAIKDGIKRSFTVYIKDNGKPGISFMGQKETDEAPGVEILLTVERDYGRWLKEAREVFYHFPVQPEVLGVSDFEVMKREYDMDNITPRAHSFIGNMWDSHRSSYAVQGPVEYPINRSILEQDENFPEHLHYLLKFRFEIHVEMGELDIAASREELSYIPLTVKNLAKYYQEIHESLTERAKEEIVQGTERENIETVHHICNSHQWHDSVLQHCITQWLEQDSGEVARITAPTLYKRVLTSVFNEKRKEIIEENKQYIGRKPRAVSRTRKWTPAEYARHVVERQFFSAVHGPRVDIDSLLSDYLSTEWTEADIYIVDVYPTYAGNTRMKRLYRELSLWKFNVLINDIGTGFGRRVRAPENQELLFGNRRKPFLVFDCYKEHDVNEVKRLLKDFHVHDNEIVYASELEKPVNGKGATKRRDTFRVLNSQFKFTQGQITPDENDSSICYIVTYGSKPLLQADDKNSVTVMDVVRRMIKKTDVSLYSKTIIAVPFKQYKKVKKDTEWTCLNNSIFDTLDNVDKELDALLQDDDTNYSIYNIEDLVGHVRHLFSNEPSSFGIRRFDTDDLLKGMQLLLDELPNDHELQEHPFCKAVSAHAVQKPTIRDFMSRVDRAEQMMMNGTNIIKHPCRDKIDEFRKKVEESCKGDSLGNDDYNQLKKYAPIMHCLYDDKMMDEHLQSLADFAIMLQDK